MSYFFVITDKGGRNGTVMDMSSYRQPQQHLIRMSKRITNEDLRDLVKKIAQTRLAPQVIGAWSDGEDDHLPVVLNYEERKDYES